MTPPPDSSSPVEKLDRVAWLSACDDALASGHHPTAIPPGCGDDLAFLRLLNQLRPRNSGSSIHSPPLPALPAVPDTGSRYELRGLQAVGGMGQVWRAFDAEMARDVALKVLRPERLQDPFLEARFVNEARITGQLQHPGVVPVYDLSVPEDLDSNDPPFYTMRLIGGRTLTAAIREYHANKTPGKHRSLELSALLNAFVSVCHTVAYAHSAGVIHRDLKPENVALGEFGEVVVLDWGFAKIIGEVEEPLESTEDFLGNAHLTAAGQVIGTPVYMAPEQAENRPVDERTDVYGLGAILFEILTGRSPYQGEESSQVLQQLRAGPPPKPRSLNPSIDRGLEAICCRAMARQPEDRYASAGEVAQEVLCWLSDEPVEAHVETRMAAWRRWARHHTSFVVASGALVLTAILGIGFAQFMVGREASRSAEERIRSATIHARAIDRARVSLQEQLYLHRVALAERALSANNLSQAIRVLEECPIGLRSWEWHCLSRLCRDEVRTLHGVFGHTGTIQSLAFTLNDEELITGSFDHTVKIWNLKTGKPRLTYEGHASVVYDLALSPNGTRVASASWDGTVQVWDLASGEQRLKIGGHSGHVDRVLFTPDGRRLLSVDQDHVVREWNAENGQLIRKFDLKPDSSALALSPNGSMIAVVVEGNIVQVLDYDTGEILLNLEGHRHMVRALVFSPDSRLLASGSGDIGRGDPGDIKVWNLADGRSSFSFQSHTDPIFSLAFTPGGDRLASASQDHMVKIWDLNVGQEALTLHAHSDVVRAVAFSHDGRSLASGGADRAVRVWNAAPYEETSPARESRLLTAHHGRALGLALHPNGSEIMTVWEDKVICFWDLNDPSYFRRIEPSVAWDNRPGQAWDRFTVVYSSDGQLAATASSLGDVEIFRPATGALVHAIPLHQSGPIKGLAFRPGNRELASAGWDRIVRTMDVATGKPRLTLTGHTEPVVTVAYAPNGMWLATAGQDQTVRIWNADTGEEIRVLRRHASAVFAVAVSPDGQLLASASNDGTVRLWDTHSWQEYSVIRGHSAGVRAIAFRPDGRVLATAGNDWSIRLWSTDTEHELAVLRGHTDRVQALTFSLDGRSLASAGNDGTVRIWNVADIEE